MSSHSTIILPDDSARPILDAIDAATKSLRVKMFVFSDPALLKAVIAAQHRGVKVRVMLNPARRDGEGLVEIWRARARIEGERERPGDVRLGRPVGAGR